MPVGDGSGSRAHAVMLGAVIRGLRESLERAGVDRRHFLTDVVGVSIAHLVASDLIELGFAAARNGGWLPHSR